MENQKKEVKYYYGWEEYYICIKKYLKTFL
jgi:hypothetical protein